jgi:hypothetical protein
LFIIAINNKCELSTNAYSLKFFTIFAKFNNTTMSDEFEKNDRGDLFSKPVRAGKRTYFFDVKSTKGNDYYLTITESKKRFGDDGKFFYEKHKIFLYKEDFEKFIEGLNEAVDHIKENAPPTDENSNEHKNNSEVNFEDLGN